MTSSMNSRYCLMFVVAIAMVGAIAVGGSVWAKGGQQTTMMDTPRIDVWAIHGAVNVAALPLLEVHDPF